MPRWTVFAPEKTLSYIVTILACNPAGHGVAPWSTKKPAFALSKQIKSFIVHATAAPLLANSASPPN
jgi:hypothetical protein